MLYVNMFFIPMKLITNYFTYNAMSAHLPLWFGQGTVFNIVLIVMAMQVPVRGMICGTCKNGCGCGSRSTKKGPKCCENANGGYWKEMATFLRKYHGYYIAFGVTNDWYYHPMEATPGHLSGIMNDLFFFWQVITIYTPTHRNKWWCIACEFAVTLHGPLIALGRGGGAGMFGFGFSMVFIVTGQWGLPLKWYWRASFFIIFITTVLLNYGLGWSSGFNKPNVGWSDMSEITRIPSLYYIIMALYFAFWMMFRCINNIKHRNT